MPIYEVQISEKTNYFFILVAEDENEAYEVAFDILSKDDFNPVTDCSDVTTTEPIEERVDEIEFPPPYDTLEEKYL